MNAYTTSPHTLTILVLVGMLACALVTALFVMALPHVERTLRNVRLQRSLRKALRTPAPVSTPAPEWTIPAWTSCGWGCSVEFASHRCASHGHLDRDAREASYQRAVAERPLRKVGPNPFVQA